MEILAEAEQITGPETLDLLRTAAVYHDCGFIRQYKANEPVAAEMASEYLRWFGYTVDQIAFVNRLILVTTLGAEPKDVYVQIIKDADFDYLGQDGYWEISLKLKEEWSHVGIVFDMPGWIELQDRFLTGHRFSTNSALKLREPKKQEFLGMIKAGHYRK